MRHEPEKRRHDDRHQRRRAGDVAAEHPVGAVAAALLDVVRLLGEQDQPHRRGERREGRLGRLADAQVADLLRAGDDAEEERPEQAAHRAQDRAETRLDDEAAEREPALAERRRLVRREAP